jgi:hypothetical protein
MRGSTRPSLWIVGSLAAVFFVTAFLVAIGMRSEWQLRAPDWSYSLVCFRAPERAMALYGLHPIDHDGQLWVCGTLLGNQYHVPAFFCYPMENCEQAAK